MHPFLLLELLQLKCLLLNGCEIQKNPLNPCGKADLRKELYNGLDSETGNVTLIYGLNLRHKHLPEIQKVCGLALPPVFSPILGDFYEGMATSVMLPGFCAEKVWESLTRHYEGQKMVSVAPLGGDESVIYASTLAGKDTMRLLVTGHENQTIVTALFDNLGKGASGAAIQNMNILLGIDETTGLSV